MQNLGGKQSVLWGIRKQRIANSKMDYFRHVGHTRKIQLKLSQKIDIYPDVAKLALADSSARKHN